jgi:hypothetical protein
MSSAGGGVERNWSWEVRWPWQRIKITDVKRTGSEASADVLLAVSQSPTRNIGKAKSGPTSHGLASDIINHMKRAATGRQPGGNRAARPREKRPLPHPNPGTKMARAERLTGGELEEIGGRVAAGRNYAIKPRIPGQEGSLGSRAGTRARAVIVGQDLREPRQVVGAAGRGAGPENSGEPGHVVSVSLLRKCVAACVAAEGRGGGKARGLPLILEAPWKMAISSDGNRWLRPAGQSPANYKPGRDTAAHWLCSSSAPGSNS